MPQNSHLDLDQNINLGAFGFYMFHICNFSTQKIHYTIVEVVQGQHVEALEK